MLETACRRVSVCRRRLNEWNGKEGQGLRAVLGIRGDNGGLGAEFCEGGGGAGGSGRVGAQLLQGVFVEVEGGDLDAFEAAHEAVGGGADEEGAEEGQAGADDAEGGLD